MRRALPACSSPTAWARSSPPRSTTTRMSQSVGFNIGPADLLSRRFERGRTSRAAPVGQSAAHRADAPLGRLLQHARKRRGRSAISTPIYRDDNEGRQFEGILVLTVNLGDFRCRTTGAVAERTTGSLVLVDSRETRTKIRARSCSIRCLTSWQPKAESVPEALLGPLAEYPSALAAKEHRVLRPARQSGPSAAIDDPLGKLCRDAGRALAERAYDRRWLAAAAPVLPPIGAAENSRIGPGRPGAIRLSARRRSRRSNSAGSSSATAFGCSW